MNEIRDGYPYFNPSFGNRPLHIVGREKELSLLRAGLAGAPATELRAPIIIGQRSFGKTAMLIEAECMAQSLGFACASVAVNRSMLQNTLDGLLTSGSSAIAKKAHISDVSIGAFGVSFNVSVTREMDEVKGFQAKLGIMLDRLSERGLGGCILVDEIQPNSEELRELAQAYQHFSGRGANVSLIMAGLPRCVSSTLNDKVSTFLYRADRILLGPIATDSIYLYFKQAFGSMGIAFAEGEMLRAARLSAGMPYMMQLVGRNLSLMAPTDGEVGPSVVNEAVDLAKEKLERNVFAPCLDTMSERDITFAHAMLEDEGRSSAADLKRRLGMSDADYQQTRRRNIDNGIIVSNGYGSVSFAMPYFSEYLRREG